MYTVSSVDQCAAVMATSRLLMHYYWEDPTKRDSTLREEIITITLTLFGEADDANRDSVRAWWQTDWVAEIPQCVGVDNMYRSPLTDLMIFCGYQGLLFTDSVASKNNEGRDGVLVFDNYAANQIVWMRE